MPGGHARNIVFGVHGHVWDKEPYILNSTRIGPTPSPSGKAPALATARTNHFDAVLRYGAGGKFEVPGDYLVPRPGRTLGSITACGASCGSCRSSLILSPDRAAASAAARFHHRSFQILPRSARRLALRCRRKPRTTLERILDEAREIKIQQEDLAGRRQAATQRLNVVVDEGRETARKLRALVIAELGTRSEQLPQFGITPNRKGSRKTKTVEVPVQTPDGKPSL